MVQICAKSKDNIKVFVMDTRLIRQLWSTVHACPSSELAGLDDSSLMASLVELLQSHPDFDVRNVPDVSRYISARIPLIREMSQQS